MASNKESMKSESSKSKYRSHRSTTRTKASDYSSKSIMNAIAEAAARKAEMQARADALTAKLDLELEEFHLQQEIKERDNKIKLRMKELEQHKERLAIQIEIKAQEARLLALEGYDDDDKCESSQKLDSLGLPAKDREGSVRQWLQCGTIGDEVTDAEKSGHDEPVEYRHSHEPSSQGDVQEQTTRNPSIQHGTASEVKWHANSDCNPSVQNHEQSLNSPVKQLQKHHVDSASLIENRQSQQGLQLLTHAIDMNDTGLSPPVTMMDQIPVNYSKPNDSKGRRQRSSSSPVASSCQLQVDDQVRSSSLVNKSPMYSKPVDQESYNVVQQQNLQQYSVDQHIHQHGSRHIASHLTYTSVGTPQNHEGINVKLKPSMHVDMYDQRSPSIQPHRQLYRNNVDEHVQPHGVNQQLNQQLSPTPMNLPPANVDMYAGQVLADPTQISSGYTPISHHASAANQADQPLSDILRTQNELTRMLMEQQIRATLPPQRVQHFNGDPLAYTAFMKSFEYSIESKTRYGLDRLHYLDQYTSGEPNNLVKSCLLYDDPDEGYKAAKGLLKKKYGNSHKVAEAFLRKAQDWPEIKPENAEGLEKFSLFLAECMTMMTSLSALDELNHTKGIQALVAKLPYRLRVAWRNKAYAIEDQMEQAVVFKDFVEFVDTQAKILANPAYGKINNADGRSSTRSDAVTKKPARRSAFTTSVENSTGHCLFCGDKSKHALKECRKFGAESAKSKSDFCFQNKLCFGCLGSGHVKAKCRQPEKCDKCKKGHPTILHHSDKKEKDERHNAAKKQKDTKGNQPTVPTPISTGYIGAGKQVTNPKMTILPVLVKMAASSEHISTYAFTDNGCGAVFVDTVLQRTMKARTKQAKLVLKTMNLEEIFDTEVITDPVQVGNLHGNHFIDLPTVFVKDNLPVGLEDVPTQADLDKWEHLQQIKLPELTSNCIPKVTIMIGSNVPEATLPLEVVTSEIPNQPYAIRSPLGWLVYGLPGKLTDQNDINVNFCRMDHAMVQTGLEHLEQQLKQYINMDFNESLSDHRIGKSAEDQRFLDIVSSTVEFKEGKYHVALPFRNNDLTMPDNRQLAQLRAENLKRKLDKDPQYHAAYKTAMTKVLQDGYAEKVPNDELVADGKKWYIPHHGIIHPQKGKLRIVYDCAAEYHGTSLNSQLMQGPDLTNSLIGVLLRFRQEPVAILSDIEAMFYQVKVKENDTNWLRFLWWPDGDTTKELQDYRMKVHIFGATSSPACANFALKKTADDNSGQFDAEVINTVHRNFYVDDCIKSSPTETKAVDLAHDLREVCSKGGFHLTKWVTNSKKVLESIPESERAETTKNLNFDDDNVQSHRALGLLWSMKSDTFKFSIDVCDKPPTRRGMLSLLSSVYDPLGLVSPAILPAKMMLQKLCKLKIGWDEKIPSECQMKWNKWVTSLPELEQLDVQRCIKPEGFEDLKSTELHHFSDASDSGYGTVSYLRLTNSEDSVECNLIMSKARVAPLKQVSIPRMELTAATVAVKMDGMLKRELEFPIDRTVFWTDSETVLKYIRNDRARYPVFVANRIAVIRDGSDVDQWKYVPSKLNPADYASRGVSVSQLISLQQWLKGPDFLYEAPELWSELCSAKPAVEKSDETANESDLGATVNTVLQEEEDKFLKEGKNQKEEEDKFLEEEKNQKEEDDKFHKKEKNQKEEEDKFQNQDKKQKEEQEQDPMCTLISHYSGWTRLKRAVAWWLKLKQLLLNKCQHSDKIEEKALTVQDIEKAEKAIILHVQKKSFPEEIKLLEEQSIESDKTSQPRRLKKTSKLANLDPQMNNGILRVGGRLSNAPISEDSKHQLILPKDHHVTDLILMDTHDQCHHQGKNHMLAKLREKYWVIRAGVAVKSLIRRCVICRKQRAKVGTQKMSDLPAYRLQPQEPAFTRSGVDYFGPLMVKVGRTAKKRYGVLFTCLASRAVHIEVAENLDTSSCISAIRRFVARRGAIQELHSDNGTNLVGANKELKAALEDIDQDRMQAFNANQGIKWFFNAPAASHHGGVWERQIRTVRKILQSILQSQYMKTSQRDEQLRTFLCEVESTINSRPLTRISPDDPNDLEVLTPNDLLLLRSGTTGPPGDFINTDVYAKKRWRQMQYLADLFWHRWIREYLPDLQQRQKWLYPERNLQEGDIVLIVDDTAPRNSWLMGKVLQALPDRHGRVRQAQVKTKTSTLLRPISKLCLLLEADK